MNKQHYASYSVSCMDLHLSEMMVLLAMHAAGGSSCWFLMLTSTATLEVSIQFITQKQYDSVQSNWLLLALLCLLPSSISKGQQQTEASKASLCIPSNDVRTWVPMFDGLTIRQTYLPLFCRRQVYNVRRGRSVCMKEQGVNVNPLLVVFHL